MSRFQDRHNCLLFLTPFQLYEQRGSEKYLCRTIQILGDETDRLMILTPVEHTTVLVLVSYRFEALRKTFERGVYLVIHNSTTADAFRASPAAKIPLH